jgi:hypothetical protein
MNTDSLTRWARPFLYLIAPYLIAPYKPRGILGLPLFRWTGPIPRRGRCPPDRIPAWVVPDLVSSSLRIPPFPSSLLSHPSPTFQPAYFSPLNTSFHFYLSIFEKLARCPVQHGHVVGDVFVSISRQRALPSAQLKFPFIIDLSWFFGGGPLCSLCRGSLLTMGFLFFFALRVSVRRPLPFFPGSLQVGYGVAVLLEF